MKKVSSTVVSLALLAVATEPLSVLATEYNINLPEIASLIDSVDTGVFGKKDDDALIKEDFAYKYKGATLTYDLMAVNDESVANVTGIHISATGSAQPEPVSNVTVPSKVVYKGDEYSVKSIGATADGNLREVKGSLVLENGIEQLKFAALRDFSGLTSVAIPKSCYSIGTACFDGCSNLTEIIVDKDNKFFCVEDGVLYNKDKTELILYPAKKEGDSFTVPSSVKIIRYAAFQDCTSLKSIDFSKCTSLGRIEDNAFAGCKKLTKIYLPCTGFALESRFNISGFGIDEKDPTKYTIPYGGTTMVQNGKSVYIANDDEFIEGTFIYVHDWKNKDNKKHICDLCYKTENHASVSATCNEPQKCSGCGCTINATGHTWEDNGDGKHKCSSCSETEEHKFTNYTYNNDATCTDAGTKTAQCDICGKSNTITDDEHSALGHDLTEATCTEDAKCTRDGCDYVEVNSRLGHELSAATCTEDAKCTREGCSYSKNGTALGHQLSEATCTDDEHCTRTGCDYVKNGSALGHNLSAATCTEDAKCTRDGCGHVEVNSKLGHDLSEATCTEPAMCKREGCDYTEGETLEHKFEYSDEETHTCALCGETVAHEMSNNKCKGCGYTVADVSTWGDQNTYSGIDHFVAEDGTTSVEVTGNKIIWLKEESYGTSAWYGLDNTKGVFKQGSRFWVKWLNKASDPVQWQNAYDQMDNKYKEEIEDDNAWIFLVGVTDPDDKKYTKFGTEVPFFIELGDDWDKKDIKARFISKNSNEIVDVSYVDSKNFPGGIGDFAKLKLKHFSTYVVYDSLNDQEKANLKSSQQAQTYLVDNQLFNSQQIKIEEKPVQQTTETATTKSSGIKAIKTGDKSFYSGIASTVATLVSGLFLEMQLKRKKSRK